MNRLAKWLVRLRTLLWTALTLVILTAAVLVGVGKLLMPYSEQYKPRLEAWLSREFNQPVRVESFTGEWRAFGPRISIEGLNLLGGAGDDSEIAIQRAALDIKPLNTLVPGRPLYSFRIIGADLSMVRHEDGRFEVSGLGVQKREREPKGGSGLSNLARLGEVHLQDSSLRFDDAGRQIHAQLVDVNGRLQLNGDEFAVEVQAGISDQRRRMVLGDVAATMLVTLDDEQRLANLKWHVKTGELMASELGKQFPEHKLSPLSGWLNAEAWGSWAPGEAQQMQGVLDIREASLAADEGPLMLSHLNTRFNWTFNDKRSWRIDLSDVQFEESGRQWNSQSISVERNIAGGVGVWVSADYLDVEFPLQVTQHIMETFNARWPQNVPTAAQGSVENFDIIINADKQLSAFIGEFKDLNVTEWEKWPLVGSVDASVELLFGQGDAQISGQGVAVAWPRNFRSPAIVNIPECQADIMWWPDKAWQFEIHDCEVANEAIELIANTRFASNPGKPVVDINVYARRADLAALKDYWPESVMKPKVTDWLGRALVTGEITDARFSMSGDMDDFPFRDRQGLLQAHAKINGARVDYHPGWPVAMGVDADVVFRGTGMEVEGSITSLAGSRVDSVSVSVADFKQPMLNIGYATQTGASELVDFLDESPLLSESALDLDQFQLEGGVSTSGLIRIPLGETPGELAVNGSVDFQGTHFQELRSGLRLESITGLAEFDEDGFSGEDIATDYLGWPGLLQLQSDWDAEQVFTARLRGQYPVAALLNASPLKDDPLLARATGESTWDIDFSVINSPGLDENEIWLQMTSGLRGITIDLPTPLAKQSAEIWPVELRYPIQASEPVFTADFNQKLNIAVETAQDQPGPVRANLNFGSEPGVLPAAGLFSVSGETAEFDLDGWLKIITDYFGTERYSDGMSFNEATLQVERLRFLNRDFANVEMRSEYDDFNLTSWFDSEDIAGEIRYSHPDSGVHGLKAEMQRFLLPDPVSEGMTFDTDPGELPEIHLYVEQFRYLGLDMGATRIEAYPIENGLRIESVEAISPHMNFEARGDWLMTPEGPRSDFDIILTSESLGSLVNAMDLSSVLEGGQTMIRYDAWWPGTPAAFELAVLHGEMSFSVIDGRIMNAEPGAGRMLGLMSIGALPRRLAFDFRDVFESGFGFDQVSGTLQLDSGIAHTEDLVMESTAASMTINGSSDLVNQQFDYIMTVRPGVSQALPVIGALTAGPAGAAAGLALQGILRDALGEAAEARYQIDGTWTDPVVTRLDTPNAEITESPSSNEESEEPVNE